MKKYRYHLLEQGPDDRSTYAECWGSTATSDGRLIEKANSLVDLIETADGMGHSNWSIRDTHARIWISSKGFWNKKPVKEFLAESVNAS